jgi:Protein of unknown function (DUF3376)
LVPIRAAIYDALSPYLDAESSVFLSGIGTASPAKFLAEMKEKRALSKLDGRTEALFAKALGICSKADRRKLLLNYLGFPFFDMATLPMLQGEGLDEFDPIKVDRIAPDDAVSIRSGGAAATLKGIEFNSFGAFFSRAYRENDYLWGRLHGAERMIDIIQSTLSSGLPDAVIADFKRRLFLSILDEEEGRLKHIPKLFEELRGEIAAGPLAKFAPRS